MSEYQVIARKWRPQRFGDVVGQQHVVRTLENAIRQQRTAHLQRRNQNQILPDADAGRLPGTKPEAARRTFS